MFFRNLLIYQLINNLLLVCSVCIVLFTVVGTGLMAIKTLLTLLYLCDMKQKLELGVTCVCQISSV